MRKQDRSISVIPEGLEVELFLRVSKKPNGSGKSLRSWLHCPPFPLQAKGHKMACKEALPYPIIRSTNFHYKKKKRKKKFWPAKGSLMPWPGVPRSRREAGRGKGPTLTWEEDPVVALGLMPIWGRWPSWGPSAVCTCQSYCLKRCKVLCGAACSWRRAPSFSSSSSLHAVPGDWRKGGRDQPSLAAEPK